MIARKLAVLPLLLLLIPLTLAVPASAATTGSCSKTNLVVVGDLASFDCGTSYSCVTTCRQDATVTVTGVGLVHGGFSSGFGSFSCGPALNTCTATSIIIFSGGGTSVSCGFSRYTGPTTGFVPATVAASVTVSCSTRLVWGS